MEWYYVNNGVKQGAILFPRLFCVYIDELFDILWKKQTECWVNDKFIGIVGYADDLLLLSPTLDRLQEMVKTCEEFATRNNLKFSTHHVLKQCKQCMAFTKKENLFKRYYLEWKSTPVGNICETSGMQNYWQYQWLVKGHYGKAGTIHQQS